MMKQLINTDVSRRDAERRQKQGLKYNLPRAIMLGFSTLFHMRSMIYPQQ